MARGVQFDRYGGIDELRVLEVATPKAGRGTRTVPATPPMWWCPPIR